MKNDRVVMIIRGALTDDQLDVISDMVHAVGQKVDIAADAAGRIVEIGVDCGEGRTMRCRLDRFFDFIRVGLFDDAVREQKMQDWPL